MMLKTHSCGRLTNWYTAGQKDSNILYDGGTSCLTFHITWPTSQNFACTLLNIPVYLVLLKKLQVRLQVIFLVSKDFLQNVCQDLPMCAALLMTTEGIFSWHQISAQKHSVHYTLVDEITVDHQWERVSVIYRL